MQGHKNLEEVICCLYSTVELFVRHKHERLPAGSIGLTEKLLISHIKKYPFFLNEGKKNLFEGRVLMYTNLIIFQIF